jgi:uncharacterized delta-60 repeat protein
MRQLHTHLAGTLVALLSAWAAPQTLLAQAQEFAVARYSSADGSPDPCFDGDGLAATNFDSSDFEMVNAVAPYPKGKTVAVGFATVAGVNKFALARYNDSGSLDTTFNGVDGKIIVSFADGFANAVAVQRDGKLIVAGGSYQAGVTGFDVIRYNANGSLDTTFNGSGRNWFTFASSTIQRATGLAIQPDGKIVVVGGANINGYDQFAVARLTTKGLLDASFGSGGEVLTDFPTTYEAAGAVALQSDGKIVVGGTAGGGSTANQFAVARYNKNGKLDSAFNGGGIALTTLPSPDGEAIGADIRALTILTEGTIVAAGVHYDLRDTGWGYAMETTQLAVARYNKNGSPVDAVVSDFAPAESPPWSWYLAAVAIGADGKIFAAGEADIFTKQTLACYNADGSRDTTFGTGGMVSSERGRGDFQAVAIDAGYGKIIAAGWCL